MEITKKQAKIAFMLLSGAKFVNEKNKWAATRNIQKLKKTVEDIDGDGYELRLELAILDTDGSPKKSDKGDLLLTKENEITLLKKWSNYLEGKISFDPYKFTLNKEILEQKEVFINNDLDFLLSDEYLKEPTEKTQEEIINELKGIATIEEIKEKYIIIEK